MLDVLYVPQHGLREVLEAPEHALAVVRYGQRAEPPPSVVGPVITVPLTPLGDEPLVELWRSVAPVTPGLQDGIRYAVGADALFGVCEHEEPRDSLLDDVTEEVYGRILRLTRARGYLHLIRVWNYYDRIDRAQDGLERYRRFCLGRHRAFARFGATGERVFPAASVIGTHTPGLIVYFLAARQAGLPIENPRQVSAFRYPPQYGLVSPSFSRAMAKTWSGQTYLYVSGTASIVGHATVHAHDAEKQLAETLRNLEALLVQAAAVIGGGRSAPSAGARYKVYLRQAQAYAPVRAALVQALGPQACIVYLLGDPCRLDLCVEIEACFALTE